MARMSESPSPPPSARHPARTLRRCLPCRSASWCHSNWKLPILDFFLYSLFLRLNLANCGGSGVVGWNALCGGTKRGKGGQTPPPLLVPPFYLFVEVVLIGLVDMRRGPRDGHALGNLGAPRGAGQALGGALGAIATGALPRSRRLLGRRLGRVARRGSGGRLVGADAPDGPQAALHPRGPLLGGWG